MITLRLDASQKQTLDTIAASIDRDRNYVLNEAVNAFIETYDWQVAHITKGLEQADKGEYASETDIKKAFLKWRR
jgi:predicted transcriptional regulator